METESTLSIVNKDNSVDTILPHHDGHPSNIVNFLIKHLNTYEKVKKFIESSNSFSIHYDSLFKFFLDTNNKKEWNYLFKNDKWYVSKDISTTYELIDE